MTAAACAIAVLFGCVGGRGGEVESLTDVLTVGQSEHAAECQAALLQESDMSDEGVVKFAFGVGSNNAMDDDFDLQEIAADLSDDDRDAFNEIADEFEACMD